MSEMPSEKAIPPDAVCVARLKGLVGFIDRLPKENQSYATDHCRKYISEIADELDGKINAVEAPATWLPCPFCDSFPYQHARWPHYLRCPNTSCALYYVSIDPKRWNNRFTPTLTAISRCKCGHSAEVHGVEGCYAHIEDAKDFFGWDYCKCDRFIIQSGNPEVTVVPEEPQEGQT